MEVRELTTETERQRAVPLLRQLWSDADPAAILAWTGEDDYTLLGGFVDSEALASPLAKEDVHRYYEARDYERWGYVIEKEL